MVRTLKLALISLVLGLIILAGVVAHNLAYPEEWDQIHLGMPRSEVESLIGPDPGEMHGLGMAEWNDNGLLIRNQLQLYMDPFDGTTIISVERFSTWPEHRLSVVRYELMPEEERGRSKMAKLAINGIDIGSKPDAVLKQLGKPTQIERQGENPCGGKKVTYQYEGLVVTFDPVSPANDDDISVIALDVSSPKWVIDPGFRVGADQREILKKFGRPAYYPSVDSIGYWIADGGADFDFKDGFLTKIHWEENLC